MTSPNTQDGRLQRMHKGREASAVRGYIDPYISAQIEGLIQRQAAVVRSGDPSKLPVLHLLAAQITALLDLSTTLSTIARQGEEAARKELQDAE